MVFKGNYACRADDIYGLLQTDNVGATGVESHNVCSASLCVSTIAMFESRLFLYWNNSSVL